MQKNGTPAIGAGSSESIRAVAKRYAGSDLKNRKASSMPLLPASIKPPKDRNDRTRSGLTALLVFIALILGAVLARCAGH